MKYIIVYDISDDSIRNEVRRYLKDMGGDRIQYSAFLFEASAAEIKGIMSEIRRIIGPSKARVIAIPICGRDEAKVLTIIHNYEIHEEEDIAI